MYRISDQVFIKQVFSNVDLFSTLDTQNALFLLEVLNKKLLELTVNTFMKSGKVLEELYYTVRQEDRFYILEALGQLSTKQSMPFLMKLLAEPFIGIRMAAASIVIQNLYH